MTYKLIDVNESYTDLITDDIQFKKKVIDTLSVYEEGYKFSPQFRAGIWDGKRNFYKIMDNHNIRFPKGLVGYIIKDLQKSNYEYEYETTTSTYDIQIDDFMAYIETLDLPFQPYDYQITAAFNMIKDTRGVQQAATGSGKSLIIYLFLRYMNMIGKRTILVVPSISLVSQMYTDFEDYGMKNASELIKQIGGEFKGTKDLSEKPIVISTWQSLQNFNKEQFEIFDAILADEAHTVKGEVLNNIINKALNARWKLGLTGTVPRTRVDKLQLLGTLGRVYKVITPGGLIKRGLATPIRINCLYFTYSQMDKNKLYKSKPKYPDEEKFISTHVERNKKTASLLSKLSKTGNVLGLFSKIEHGETILSNLIEERTGEKNFQLLHKLTPKPLKEAFEEYQKDRNKLYYMNSPITEADLRKARKTVVKIAQDEDVAEDFLTKIRSLDDINIFFITGATSGTSREDIRMKLETVHVSEGDQGAIILGSYAIVATGVNYKNLRHIVYCSSLKSYIKIVQSIGRGMRLHDKKSIVDVWDIVDDITYQAPRSEKQNYVLKHFYERVEFYREAEYEILEKEIQLN